MDFRAIDLITKKELRNLLFFKIFTKNIYLDSFSPDRGFGGAGPSSGMLKRLSQIFPRTAQLLGKLLKKSLGFRAIDLITEKEQC